MNESREGKLSLSDQFKSGVIDSADFLSAINTGEMSNGTHPLAAENAELLSDPTIKQKLTENPETAWDYWNSLSLALFHEAQRALQDGSLDPDVLAQAVEAASNMDSEGDEDWLQYLKATQAYANGDLTLLETLADSISNKRNAKVVKNLIDGLRTRGNIDYAEDYGKF